MDTNDVDETLRIAVKHFMDIFIMPEVVRRQEAGELPRPLDLRAAQIIFPPDGRRPFVRINSEVRAIAKMKLKEGVSKNPGDPVCSDELEGLEDLSLPEDDCPDCGHATLFMINDQWFFAFDFIYNKSLAKKHILAANEFIDTARHAMNQRHWSAFVDNAFSAAELLAKANLLAFWVDPKFRNAPTHGFIHSRFNQYAHLGKIDVQYVETFNLLSKLRAPARYLEREYSLSESDTQKILDTLDTMNKEISRLIRMDQK